MKPTVKLCEMLRYRRPAWSFTEEIFISRFLDSVPGMKRDGFGNRFLNIGDSKVLWSSHTDTVHSKPGMQRINYSGGRIALAKKERKSSCLGADDTTGVFLMLEMIQHRVPGRYIFHRAEEIGGVGSDYIANRGILLEGIEFAIALDRKGKDSVITHMWGRCASDEFADSLADVVNAQGLEYYGDASGLFTDTAHYDSIVPECSNLSVGYENAHSRFEYQDVTHAMELRESLLKFDESRLVSARIPGTVEFTWSDERVLPGNVEYVEEEETDSRLVDAVAEFPDIARDCLNEIRGTHISVAYVAAAPDDVAYMLEEEGYSLDSFLERVWVDTGIVPWANRL